MDTQRQTTVNKIAKISLLFWVMKIVATTLGETLGDYIAQTLNLGYLVGIGITLIFFVIALLLQLSSKKYVPALFWLVIIGTTTLGTEISDFIDRSLHFGYAAGSLLLVSLLGLTLYLWYRKYGNLEVTPVYERPNEILFWTAVLFSNSLGTAFGDYLNDGLGFTYLTGALVTLGVIAVVLMLHYFNRINEILLFWVAFVFTRPFGATFGDFLTKPTEKGGLDLGTLPATTVSLILMMILIVIAHWQIHKENHLID